MTACRWQGRAGGGRCVLPYVLPNARSRRMCWSLRKWNRILGFRKCLPGQVGRAGAVCGSGRSC
eukprot:358526-Chlamydomonas_euryale.AAC.2